MKYYFIDYENVRKDGLKNAEVLKKGDRVILMYSRNANTVTFPVLEDIIGAKERGVEFTYIDVKHLGANALDFQLSALLGYMIGKFRGKELVISIVSKDKGFDSLVLAVPEMFQRPGLKISVSRDRNLGDSNTKSEKKETKKQEHKEDKVVSLEKSRREKALETILINKLKSNGVKQEEITQWISFLKNDSLKGTAALQNFKSVSLPKMYPGKLGKKKRNDLIKRLESDVKNLLQCYKSNYKMSKIS